MLAVASIATYTTANGVVRQVGSTLWIVWRPDRPAGWRARDGANIDNAAIATSSPTGENLDRGEPLPDLAAHLRESDRQFSPPRSAVAAHRGEPLGPQRVDLGLVPREQRRTDNPREQQVGQLGIAGEARAVQVRTKDVVLYRTL